MHALAVLGDGSVLAAGETVDAAVSANRHMQVARITATGTMAAWGTGGFARSRVAGGNNTGQAMVVQGDGSVIVGGSANLAGKTAFALTRFGPTGARDVVFGNTGETTTPFGTPAVNGYITGMALSGNMLAVAGRLTNAAGLVVTAARYWATGAPPPPPPPPAVSTLGVDGITSSGARVTGTVNANGTAATWWLEYGTTTAYGTKSAVQNLAATTNDVDVGVNVTGLAPGTRYHARLVIANAIGTTPGDTVTFVTLGSAGGRHRPGRAREERQEDLQGAQGRRQEAQRRAQEGLRRGLQVQGRLQEVEAAQEHRAQAVAQGQQEARLPRGREAHRLDEVHAQEEGQGQVDHQGLPQGQLGPATRSEPPLGGFPTTRSTTHARDRKPEIRETGSQGKRETTTGGGSHMRRLIVVLAAIGSLATPAALAQGTYPEKIALPNAFAPEGIEIAHGNTFYVGSVQTGAIYSGSLRSGAGQVLIPGAAPGTRGATGIEYDHGKLWVAGAGGGTARVYDVKTGALIREYQLAPPPATFINDVVVTKKAAYFTDSQQPVDLRIALGKHGAPGDQTTIPLTGDYQHLAGQFNLNGIVATANGKTLIAVQSAPSGCS